MELKGWQFNIVLDMPSDCGPGCELSNCGDKTWYGYNNIGHGDVRATFSGTGTATLDFGNCHPSRGETNVLLMSGDNIRTLDTAEKNTPSKQIMFDFSPGEVLLIGEADGVIKLNSLTLNCKGE